MPRSLTGRGAGISTHPQLHDVPAARHPVRQFDGDSGRYGRLPRPRRQDLRRARHRAGDELVGPRLPLVARSAAGRKLSSRHVAAAHRAGRRGRHRGLRRRHARARRSADRRRRRALDGARAVPAGIAAEICRICRLARDAGRERHAAGDPRRRFSRATPTACRRANCSSPTPCPAATTRPSPASAPTTSSGTGRPRRSSSPTSAPTRAARATAPRSRRR